VFPKEFLQVGHAAPEKERACCQVISPSQPATSYKARACCRQRQNVRGLLDQSEDPCRLKTPPRGLVLALPRRRSHVAGVRVGFKVEDLARFVAMPMYGRGWLRPDGRIDSPKPYLKP